MVDKTNFIHAGWFHFELLEDGKEKETAQLLYTRRIRLSRRIPAFEQGHKIHTKYILAGIAPYCIFGVRLKPRLLTGLSAG